MECPACGQINTDDASTCLSCGQLLYMGGASIDTTDAEGRDQIIIAGNIDFPLPPSDTPDSPQPTSPPPVSSRLPKPSSLPRVEIETAATEEKLSQTAADEAPKPPPLKKQPSSSPLPPPSPPSLDASPRATATRRSAHMIYAGFWYRFLAWFIDIIILLIVQSVLGAVALMTSLAVVFRGADFSASSPWVFAGAYGVMVLVSIALSLLYFSVSESSRWQGTLGKLAIGLKVTDADGNRISFLRSLGRYFSHIVTNLTFGLGYVLNVFTARQQALHDLMTGTLVVHREVTAVDLVYHPAVPARAAQKASVLLVWAMSTLFLLSVVLVGQSLVETPKHQVSTAAVRMHDAEKLGAQATAAVTDYWETYGSFPPTLDAADFHQTSPQVRRARIDAESGVIYLELGFSPLRKKTLAFVPEIDEEDDLIWRCHSDDIDPQYLPEHCR